MKNIDLEIYRTQIEQGVDFKAMADEFQLDENEIKDRFKDPVKKKEVEKNPSILIENQNS